MAASDCVAASMPARTAYGLYGDDEAGRDPAYLSSVGAADAFSSSFFQGHAVQQQDYSLLQPEQQQQYTLRQSEQQQEYALQQCELQQQQPYERHRLQQQEDQQQPRHYYGSQEEGQEAEDEQDVFLSVKMQPQEKFQFSEPEEREGEVISEQQEGDQQRAYEGDEEQQQYIVDGQWTAETMERFIAEDEEGADGFPYTSFGTAAAAGEPQHDYSLDLLMPQSSFAVDETVPSAASSLQQQHQKLRELRRPTDQQPPRTKQQQHSFSAEPLSFFSSGIGAAAELLLAAGNGCSEAAGEAAAGRRSQCGVAATSTSVAETEMNEAETQQKAERGSPHEANVLECWVRQQQQSHRLQKKPLQQRVPQQQEQQCNTVMQDDLGIEAGTHASGATASCEIAASHTSSSKIASFTPQHQQQVSASCSSSPATPLLSPSLACSADPSPSSILSVGPHNAVAAAAGDYRSAAGESRAAVAAGADGPAAAADASSGSRRGFSWSPSAAAAAVFEWLQLPVHLFKSPQELLRLVANRLYYSRIMAAVYACVFLLNFYVLYRCLTLAQLDCFTLAAEVCVTLTLLFEVLLRACLAGWSFFSKYENLFDVGISLLCVALLFAGDIRGGAPEGKTAAAGSASALLKHQRAPPEDASDILRESLTAFRFATQLLRMISLGLHHSRAKLPVDDVDFSYLQQRTRFNEDGL